MHELVLGIDVGGTNIGFGLVDREGKTTHYSHVPTRSERPATEIFSEIFDQVQQWLRANPQWKLNAVGIGAPNTNYHTATLENPPNLKWGFLHWPTLIQQFGSWPTFATNDAKAAAIAEHLFGAGVGKSHFILLTLGTGLGGGIYAHNHLLYGCDGAAGEVGHIVLVENGRLCGCGQKGCAETYISATGLVKTYQDLSSSKSTISAAQIAALALSGDAAALDAFDKTARYLGRHLANLVLLFRPELIILGGGVAASGDLLSKPTRAYLTADLGQWAHNYDHRLQLVISPLLDIKPGVLGAAALAWTHLK